MAVQIRRATMTDARQILVLWREADVHPTHTDDMESIDRLIAHDPKALLVAVDDTGSVVGSVIATWDGWRGSIYRLVVAPRHRRRGLGRQLLRAGEERLRNEHAVRLQAIVVETDDHACAFWRSSGWEEQVERIRFVKG